MAFSCLAWWYQWKLLVQFPNGWFLLLLFDRCFNHEHSIGSSVTGYICHSMVTMFHGPIACCTTFIVATPIPCEGILQPDQTRAKPHAYLSNLSNLSGRGDINFPANLGSAAWLHRIHSPSIRSTVEDFVQYATILER